MATASGNGETSALENLFLNGFTQELISVIPPNAPLTSSSRVPPEALGKVPGRKLTTGEWSGGWVHVEDAADARRIEKWQGNIGLETTRILPIDIDVNDPALHKPLIALARRIFGPDLPVRMGKRPLLFGRITGKKDIGRSSFVFTDGLNDTHKVESFFGAQKHFVIKGRHPSGIDYTCDPPLEKLIFDELPEITTDQVREYFDAAQTLLKKRYHCTIGKKVNDNAAQERPYEKPDDSKILASVEHTREILNKIPNTKGRDRWVDLCHAVRGATQKDPEAGRKLWMEWCASREDGDAHLREAKRVWDSVGRQNQGNLYIGIEALMGMGNLTTEMAQHQFGNAPLVSVDDDLLVDATANAPPEKLFCVQPVTRRALLRPEWVIRNMVPKGACIGVLYGPPGMNKSTMATAMAVHVALGLPFAGQVVRQGNVLLISEEDAVVNRRRLEAWRHWLRQKEDDVELPEQWEAALSDKIFETFPSFGHISKKKIAYLADEILRATAAEGVDVVFIDTLARTFVEGGEENEAKDMNKYIDLAEALSGSLNCPVIILHHPPKNADTLRGHGSLLGAVSMVFKVERTGDGLVRLYCQKMREAAEFLPVAFERHAVDISFAIERKEEEDDAVETALVLEHTEWTEVAGSTRGNSADDPANLGGTPQRVTDMDILGYLCMHPRDSIRAVAGALGFAGHAPLRRRMIRLEGLQLVEKKERGQWSATEKGRKIFEEEHPNGLLM